MTKTLTLQIDDDDTSNLTITEMTIIDMLGMAEFIRLSAERKPHDVWAQEDQLPEEPTADSEESNK